MDSRKIVFPGFTLLELIVVIALIGAMMAIVVPRIGGKTAKQEREEFIAQLNTLVSFSWSNALRSGKVQKVDFDFETNKIIIEESAGKKDERGQLVTTPLKRAYRSTSLKIPKQFILRNFYIEGVDEVAARGGNIAGAFFYITPEGLAQSVVINFVDRKEKRAGAPVPFGLVLNPFSAQFAGYGTFKKP